jgi:8-oxo-dGTP pyrophosphatase MutT (NUDIX family)
MIGAIIQRAVVGVILYREDGAVLLQQRDDRPDLPYPGYWTFFGGAVEQGETPDQAIARELMEELELAQPVGCWHDYECPVRTHPGHVLVRNHLYHGLLSRPLESLTLHEGQAMRFFAPAEADALDLAYSQSSVLRLWLAQYTIAGRPV